MSKHTPGQYIKEFKQKFPKSEKFRVYVRFMKCVTILNLDECWEWQGRCNDDGYGGLRWLAKGLHFAHQVAYVLFVGNIPKRHGKKKLRICHSCDNPPCCNPNHLFLGTQKQNMEDCVKKGRKASTTLTWKIVNKIRKKFATGKYSSRTLGNRYGCSKSAVWAIVNHKTWRRK